MTIKLEITGESADDVFASLVMLSRPNPETMPLDQLLAITKDRFGEAGFALKVENRNQASAEPAQAPAATPAPAPRKTKAPKAVPVVDEKKAPDAADAPATSPDEDRAFVLDQLGTRFADPKQKAKTKAFIDRVSTCHAGLRLSKLDVDKFPAIRREMDIEFGGTVVAVNGGDHAA